MQSQYHLLQVSEVILKSLGIPFIGYINRGLLDPNHLSMTKDNHCGTGFLFWDTKGRFRWP